MANVFKENLRFAKRGNIEAQYEVGKAFLYGEGVKQNYKKALKWLKLSEAGGYTEAQFQLALCYENGYGVEQNEETAMQLFIAAANDGCISAQNALGINAEADNDGSKKKLFIPVYNDALNGNAFAQYILGGMYDYGDNAPQDTKKAVYWYKKAAESGEHNAEHSLALCYKTGKGVEKDLTKTVYWLQKAAEAGLACAQSALGDCYVFGDGVAKDRQKADFWYKKAKQQYEKAAAEGDKTAPLKIEIINTMLGLK